ncbi:MAG: fibronectin type III-like domain-contianing protein [Gemmatimonas sp.]
MLAPGETERVTLDVKRCQLQFLDESLALVQALGMWRVMVGTSRRDIRLWRDEMIPAGAP